MATITFLGTTISNWSATSSWSTGTIPTLGDLVIFTSSSATCSLNTNGTCSAIDFSNYNKQFRFNANILYVYGTVSFGPNMGYSFSTSASGYNLYQLTNTTSNANLSIITNGATVGVPFVMYGGNLTTTHNITGNLNMTENLSVSPGGGAITQVVNGPTISCSKNLRFNDVGGSSAANGTTGSTAFLMTGTGNFGYAGGNSNGLGNSLTINTSGTITIVSTIYIKSNLNWIAGNAVGAFNFLWTGAGTFTNIPFNSGTYASFGIGTNGSAGIVTLANDFYTVRQIGTSGGQLNGGNIYTQGGLSNVTNTLSGSSLITITGTSSSSSATLTTTTAFNNNLVINTPGILTISGAIWGGTSFVYTAGNVSVTGNFTLLNSSDATITMPSSKFLTVNMGQAPTGNNTLLSDWNITTILLSNYNLTFTGSNVWITDILTSGNNTITNQVMTLKAGLTYSILKQFSLSNSAYTSPYTFQSGASASYTNLYLAPGATQAIYSLKFIDVNNVGTPLWLYNPTYSNSTNIWPLNWLSVQQTTINTW